MQDNRIDIRSLSAMDRIAARDKAKQIVIASHGSMPTQDQFKSHAVSKYPLWLQLVITSLTLVALVGAFTLSATNLNAIGRDTIAKTISNSGSVAAGGVAVVLLAESAQIIFSLALALVEDWRSKTVLYSGMVASTSIALVGNIEFAKPDTPFHWFVAVIPPLIVLGLGYTLKIQALHAVTNRYEAKRQFRKALAEYRKATAYPEQSSMFKPAYANALREMIIEINAKGRGKSERMNYLKSLSGDDWRDLVNNEIEAESWFTDVDIQIPQTNSQSLPTTITQREAIPATVSEGNTDFLADPPTQSNGKNGR